MATSTAIILGLAALAIIATAVQLREGRTQLQAAPVETESPIETRLLKTLRHNGYDVSTQVHCGKYRIDLALPAYRIAIECDGKAYHSTPAQKSHDRRKNAYLRQHGWSVLRFNGRRIYRDPRGILRTIDRAIARRG